MRRHEWDYFESLAFMMKRLYVMIDKAQPGVATYLPGGGNLHLLPQPGSSFLHLQIRQKSSCFSIEKVSWQRYPFEKIAGRTDQHQFSCTRTICSSNSIRKGQDRTMKPRLDYRKQVALVINVSSTLRVRNPYAHRILSIPLCHALNA